MPQEPVASPETTADASRLRLLALDAARAAAPALRAAFRGGIVAENKTNSHDLVTAQDRASELAIEAVLLAGEPDSRILGEEGGARGTGAIEWIVDPIDGTSNFAHGVAFFCISIAAARDGELLAGVVLDPIAGLEFSADAEHAYLNGEVLSPGACAEQRHASLMTDYPSAEAIALDGDAGLAEFGKLVCSFATLRRKVSAALGLAHVAAGWSDATLGLDTNPWDVAAGVLLVKRAGGSYVPYSYDDEPRPAHEAPCFVAVGPGGDFPAATGAVQRLVAARRDAGYRR